MPNSIRPFPEISSPAGHRHLLVPSMQVLQWTEATARAVLLEAMSDNEFNARDLTAVALERGCPSAEREAVATFLAAEIARGALTPIAVPEVAPRGAFPVLRPGDHAPDWDNLKPLSELRDTDPTTEWSWVSVEVLDHTGVPYADLEITLVHGDGRRDRVVLDGAGRHTARAVPKNGRTKVYWPQRLELSEEAKKQPGLDGFQRMPEDVRVPRESKGKWSNLEQMGRHYRLVVDPPTPTPTLSYASSLFASDSALPTHAITDLVTRAQEIADRDRAARFGIFGHTDTHDDADANKQLADRRAQAVFGILTGDWDTFLAAVEADELPLAAHQMMLRVLGCNPTAIDGEPGDQTSLAIASFRRAYNADTWHDEARTRAYGDLPHGDALDDVAKHALLDAYHAELAAKLDPSRFLGPKHVGCGEFNPLTEDDRDNRRVTLAIYGDDAPAHAEFPCKHGDAGACQVDGAGRFTCKFYRERMHEEMVEHELTPFWDFDWMRTLTGKTHLSALTHLPDTSDATIVVRLVDGVGQADEANGVGALPLVGEVVAELPALIRSGVAYAIWDHGPGYDPLDQRDWFRHPSEAVGEEIWLAAYRTPTFGISVWGVWGASGGPGVAVERVGVSEASKAASMLVMTPGGGIVAFRGTDAARTARDWRTTGLRAPGVFMDRGEAEDANGE